MNAPGEICEVLRDRLDELPKLCRRFRVKKLEVFGSAVRGGFDPARSDLDFLVEFEELNPGAYADAYFGFLEALEELFARRVELVVPRAIRNKYFRKSIDRHRTVLYAA